MGKEKREGERIRNRKGKKRGLRREWRDKGLFAFLKWISGGNPRDGRNTDSILLLPMFFMVFTVYAFRFCFPFLVQRSIIHLIVLIYILFW